MRSSGKEPPSNRKVFVLMRAFNSAQYIKTGINSFLVQTYGNKELIIVDDLSTDETANIAVDYASKYDNITFTDECRMKKNSGPGHTLLRVANIALRKAKKHDIICILDDDDFWERDTALQEIVERMDKTNANVCFLSFQYHGDQSVVFQSNGVTAHNAMVKELSELNKAMTIKEMPSIAQARSAMCSRAFEAHVFKKYINLFPEISEEHRLCEDATNISSLLLKGVSFTGIEEPLYGYLRRSDSLTGILSKEQIQKRLLFLGTARIMVERNAGKHIAGSLGYLFAFLINKKLDLTYLVLRELEKGTLIGYSVDEFARDFQRVVGL